MLGLALSRGEGMVQVGHRCDTIGLSDNGAGSLSAVSRDSVR